MKKKLVMMLLCSTMAFSSVVSADTTNANAPEKPDFTQQGEMMGMSAPDGEIKRPDNDGQRLQRFDVRPERKPDGAGNGQKFKQDRHQMQNDGKLNNGQCGNTINFDENNEQNIGNTIDLPDNNSQQIMPPEKPDGQQNVDASSGATPPDMQNSELPQNGQTPPDMQMNGQPQNSQSTNNQIGNPPQGQPQGNGQNGMPQNGQTPPDMPQGGQMSQNMSQDGQMPPGGQPGDMNETVEYVSSNTLEENAEGDYTSENANENAVLVDGKTVELINSTERHSRRLTIAECHVHSFRMGVGECDKIFSV